MKRSLVFVFLISIALLWTNISESYNNLTWKQSVNQLWAKSVGRDRPVPPHSRHRAYTKATTEVDFDYYQEDPWNRARGINDIIYRSHAYLIAYVWRGTWSIKVFASQSNDNHENSGTYWSAVYKEKTAVDVNEFREKDDNGDFVVNFKKKDDSGEWIYFAIDYFYLTEANAKVRGTMDRNAAYNAESAEEALENSSGSQVFSSDAEAKKFSNTAGITWWCKRSKKSDYYQGDRCRMCNN